jgi:hypothetical protein
LIIAVDFGSDTTAAARSAETRAIVEGMQG